MSIEKIATPESYVWGARHTKKGWHVSLCRQSSKRWIQYPIQGLILATIDDVHRMFPGTVVPSHYKCGCTSTGEPLYVDHLKPVPMPAQPDFLSPRPPWNPDVGL